MSDIFDGADKLNIFSEILSTNNYIFFYDETNNFRKLYLHENYSDKFYLKRFIILLIYSKLSTFSNGV